MAYLIPKNWTSFQHYRDRSPAWIKLHRELLDDFEFNSMQVASRALAPMLWLLASQYEDGKIEYKPARLAFRFRMSEKELINAIKPLIDMGFFIIEGDLEQSASIVLAECLPREEKRREEKERETEKRRGEKTALATRLPADWMPDEWQVAFCNKERPDLMPMQVAEEFRDYWIAQPGAKGRKTDWSATWRNWVRRQRTVPNKSSYQTSQEKQKLFADRLTGNKNNEQRTTFIDIN